MTHRVIGRCVDLSPSGVKLEARDPLDSRAAVSVHSERFGRMGTAIVRYCNRRTMIYHVGLEFTVLFPLSDSVRRKILDSVLRSENAA